MSRIPAVVGTLLLAVTAAHPCSEIYAGRTGVTLGPAVRPASILILKSPSLQMHAALLKSTLRQLGHRVREVDSAEGVATALQTDEGFDLVMADLEEAGALCGQLSTSASTAVLLTLLRQAPDEDTVLPQGCPLALDVSARSSALQSTIRTALEETEPAGQD